MYNLWYWKRKKESFSQNRDHQEWVWVGISVVFGTTNELILWNSLKTKIWNGKILVKMYFKWCFFKSLLINKRRPNYRFYWLIIGDWQFELRPISSNQLSGDQNRKRNTINKFPIIAPSSETLLQSEDAVYWELFSILWHFPQSELLSLTTQF